MKFNQSSGRAGLQLTDPTKPSSDVRVLGHSLSLQLSQRGEFVLLKDRDLRNEKIIQYLITKIIASIINFKNRDD